MSTIIRNLVTNPRGRNTSGTVTVRESLYNPAHMNNLAFGSGSDGNPVSILEQDVYRGYSLPVAPGDVYTITRKNITSRFRWVFTIDPPAPGVSNFGGTGQATTYDAEPTATITVPDGAAYLLLYLSNAGEDVGGLLIERGSTALPYFDATTWDGDPDLSPQWSGTPGSSAARLVAPKPVNVSAFDGVLYYSVSRDCLALRTSKAGTAAAYADFSAAMGETIRAGTVVTALTEAWTDNEDLAASAYILGAHSTEAQPLNGYSVIRRIGETTNDTITFVGLNMRSTATNVGDTVYFRSAIVLGEYHGPFFDGDSVNVGRTRYDWEGTPHASVSYVKTLRRNDYKRMYFGTEEYMQWVLPPQTDVPSGSTGWGTQTQYLNGGAHIRNSTNKAKVYQMSWSLKTLEELEKIKSYSDGLYGDGLIYFLLPGELDNVLPQSWATPRVQCEDGPPLVFDNPRPRPMASPPNSFGYPTASAHYVVHDDELERQVLTIPVPNDFVLHLGVHGTFTESISMVYSHNGGEPVPLQPLGTDTAQLTNAIVEGPGFVRLWLDGSGTATINSMVAAVRNSYEPPSGRFIPGRGHSGASFDENGFELTTYSAVKDMYHGSATFVEVGQWR